MSFTVTVVVQVETLPASSVTVSVTVLAPTLAQVKVLGNTDILAIVQLSLLLLPTWAAVSAARPLAFKNMVTGVQTALGAILSCTVTVLVLVELLPLWSVTVSVTVFAPRLAQVNDEGETLIEAIVQLS